MNPYNLLPEKFFWSSAVAKKNMHDITELWSPKFKIDRDMKISTYGSCFAQHIGRSLSHHGFKWLLSEPAPRDLPGEIAKQFNYGIFSARTGNIYTASLLNQWVRLANGTLICPDEFWTKEGRFFDPFRPNIEPNGFATKEELIASRNVAINSFRRSINSSSVLIFTLGLTESWLNSSTGFEYPMCPGTTAGVFDSKVHDFVNQDFNYVRKSLVEALRNIRALNPKIKFLLTVSPVPLTATMSGNHILVATMESKSILRAVAGSFSGKFDFVDYFPSFEIISSTPFRGTFFESNLRTVNHSGVELVMKNFFDCLVSKFPGVETPPGNGSHRSECSVMDSDWTGVEAATCEEELLRVFAPLKE